MGKDLRARVNMPKLLRMQTMVPTLGQRRVNPFEFFKQNVQLASNRPATTRKIQAIM